MPRTRARFGVLVFAVCALASLAPAFAQVQMPPRVGAHEPVVVAGIGAGVLHVDLPHPEEADDFGARPRVRFDLGYRPRAWLELAGELGMAMLGESDSLNALLRVQDRDEGAAFTFVDFGAGLRVLWPRSQRWRPFARGSVGTAWLALAAPDGMGGRNTDLAWSAGGGIDVGVFRHVILRVEGRYLGQKTENVTRTHTSMEVVLLYALTRSRMN